MTARDVAASLGVGLDGLTSAAAAERLARFGPNVLDGGRSASRLRVLWRQLRSPLVLLLVFAAIASSVTGEWVDALIVGLILFASVGIGYWREYRAETAIAALLDRVRITSQVLRDGARATVPSRDIVPGDIVLLEAGSIIPADGVLLEANELYVDEAALTGESFPVLESNDAEVHLGTNVRSGSARMLAVTTGAKTAFGAIAGKLAAQAPESDFERGLRRFGLLLLVAMLVMIVVVFAVNVFTARPPIQTLLFSIALAVGLSPELLPAILAVNLGRAASTLADAGLLVRRLDAIENLGSMDVLCTDKTGTLTEGVVSVDGAFDRAGAPSDAVMELAMLNATLHEGLPNPIDAALIQAAAGRDLSSARKLFEIPYDFTRKRVSVVVQRGDERVMIVKGAFLPVIDACRADPHRTELDAQFRAWSADGIRVIAVATRRLPVRDRYAIDDERELELAGFVLFRDRAKADAPAAIASLTALGVRLKMLTGDSRFVAAHVATEVGIAAERMLVGEDLDRLTDAGLMRAVEETDVFAEVDPNQKERVLRTLRHNGAVVGFFGDGINDAPAMHAADVAISVESAVDVAKASADLVLTRKSLDVIRRGVEEGRRTFANTLKYILTTTSANLGNMVSMAIASMVLPFLPLTAGQILLNNFLSDIPAVGLVSDSVDHELVEKPRRWDTRFIGRFMLEFGLLSSMFDALMFVILIVGFDASAATFRTGWFVESLATELVIALVVRTRRPFWRSRPGTTLIWTTVAVAIVAALLPFLPFAGALGFEAPSVGVMVAVVLVTLAYVGASEVLKSWFYRRSNAAATSAARAPVLV